MKLLSLTNKPTVKSAAPGATNPTVTGHDCECPVNIDNSLALTPAIATMGLHSVSYDQKDMYINPRHLLDRLDKSKIAELTSASPFCVNFAADGFPRIDGQPWGLSREQAESIYDPSDPETLPSFGEVISEVGGKSEWPILGFFLRLRPFDNELGSSAVKVTICEQGEGLWPLLSGTYEMKGSDACMFIPYFSPAYIERLIPMNQTVPVSGQTIRFAADVETRAQSFLVDCDYAIADGATSQNSDLQTHVMSVFTITGHNVYAYVEPVMLSKEMMGICESVLNSNPSDYLMAILRAVNGR